MDKQICGIRMVSCELDKNVPKFAKFRLSCQDAYVESQVNVTWFSLGATRYNPEIGLPEFKIVRLTADICDGSYMYAIMANTYKYGPNLMNFEGSKNSFTINEKKFKQKLWTILFNLLSAAA